MKKQRDFIIKMIGFGIVSYSVIIIITIILTGVSWFGGTQEQTIAIEKAIATEDAIIQSFLEYSRRAKNSNITVLAASVSADHAASMAAVKKNLEIVSIHNRNGDYLVIIEVFFMLFHVGFISFYLKKKTNKNFKTVHGVKQNFNVATYASDTTDKTTMLNDSGDEPGNEWDKPIVEIPITK